MEEAWTIGVRKARSLEGKGVERDSVMMGGSMGRRTAVKMMANATDCVIAKTIYSGLAMETK
jgi:hypothetical protein